MQWAEGPQAFEQGYQYLRTLFAQDPPRLEYLEELYNSPERHMFGAVHTCVYYLTCLPPTARLPPHYTSPIACVTCLPLHVSHVSHYMFPNACQVYECGIDRRNRKSFFSGEEMGIRNGTGQPHTLAGGDTYSARVCTDDQETCVKARSTDPEEHCTQVKEPAQKVRHALTKNENI